MHCHFIPFIMPLSRWRFSPTASCDLPDFFLWFSSLLSKGLKNNQRSNFWFSQSSQRKLSNNMKRHLHFYRLQIVFILSWIYVHFCTWPDRVTRIIIIVWNRVQWVLSIIWYYYHTAVWQTDSRGIRVANFQYSSDAMHLMWVFN